MEVAESVFGAEKGGAEVECATFIALQFLPSKNHSTGGSPLLPHNFSGGKGWLFAGSSKMAWKPG